MCPTLDPIENTTPKQQIVPQQNNKEILALVNQGIEKGQINIPAGEAGTKLYKHLVKMTATVNDISRDIEFILIAKTATAITSYAGGPPHFDGVGYSEICSLTACKNEYVINPQEYVNDTWLLSAALIDFSAGTNIYSLQNLVFVSDTVTEL